MNQDINGDFRGACTICGCKMYVYERSSSVMCAFCGHYPIKHLPLMEKEQCEASNSCKHLESIEKQDTDSDLYKHLESIEKQDTESRPCKHSESVEKQDTDSHPYKQSEFDENVEESQSAIDLSISYDTSASNELIITSANIASNLSDFERQFIIAKEEFESEEHSNNIYILDRENKTVKCSLCNIKLNLQ
eukprot:TCONS_00063620-protein